MRLRFLRLQSDFVIEASGRKLNPKQLEKISVLERLRRSISERTWRSEFCCRSLASSIVSVPDPGECDGWRAKETEETPGESRKVTKLD